jgi:hypothetical protein
LGNVKWSSMASYINVSNASCEDGSVLVQPLSGLFSLLQAEGRDNSAPTKTD